MGQKKARRKERGKGEKGDRPTLGKYLRDDVLCKGFKASSRVNVQFSCSETASWPVVDENGWANLKLPLQCG